MIGVSATYLSKIERDELPPPAEARVKEIARRLDQDPDELLALAGKVATDLEEIVRQRPKDMADPPAHRPDHENGRPAEADRAGSAQEAAMT